MPFGHLYEGIGAWPGDFLGQLEEPMILDLTEIFGFKQFLSADDLRTLCRGFFNQRHLPAQLFAGVRRCRPSASAQPAQFAHSDDFACCCFSFS